MCQSIAEGLLNFKFLFFVHLVAGPLLFCGLCQIIFLLLQNLHQDIKNVGYLDKDSVAFQQSLQIWQDKFQMICDLVESLNRSFGLILFVFIAFHFVWMVNSSFKVLVIAIIDPFDSELFIYLSFELFGFICFTFLMSFATSIKQQVSMYKIFSLHKNKYVVFWCCNRGDK